MSLFHDSFEQDNDYPEWYHSHAERPVLVDARVKYCIWGGGQCFAEDDRESNDTIALTAYCETGAGFGSVQEACWNYIKSHTDLIEKELRRKLWAICRENFEEFLASIDGDDTEWLELKDIAEWEHPSSLDLQVELVGIGMFDHGFDEVGFCTFDFDVGWDEEHGLSILMHKGNVLAASCSADFTGRGASIVGHAKCIQNFAFTEGDLRIEG